uniref:Ionotropic glutamate receptor C-terminal domain-containing protein n=1 Tax=Davidia involucrata TaxID=16924 RepID=A0A5B6YGT6_DAVIN
MNAVAAIVQSWQWRRVTVIYEDVNSAVNGIIPYLITALHEVGSDVDDLLPLPPLPPYSLSEKLENLKSGQCRVFIVHTSITLATNLFMEAKNMGMMEKEFVWITTDGITNQVDSFNMSIISSMQGVLGVKSYFVHMAKQFKVFSSRFQAMFHLQYPDEPNTEPGIFALQAYDAVWAVALAMEEKTNQKTFENSTNHEASIVSMNGRQLMDKISKSNFKGLAGKFNLMEGALAPASIFQIINVIGKSYRELGYWSEGLGFSVSTRQGTTYNKSMRILGQVYWPGGPWSIPRGWAVPADAKPLNIGVPANTTFSEFVNVRYDHPGGPPIVEGFSVDVFRYTVALLPYNLSYKLVPFNGSFDTLVQQVYIKKFDAVVGDTAIVANRSEYVEFSQPYADPGVQMVVFVKPRKSERAWLFGKPFTTNMWVITILVNIYNGFVIWCIEQKDNEYFGGTWFNQIGTTIWITFTTLFSTLPGISKGCTSASRHF